jgi:tetratricopeptide (TPR) repeat protein/SAM-dependent methyltransferase
MIVKNETAIIERCLAAAAPHIDCYVICDTGSTDATIEVIRRFFERRGIPGRIPTATFRNFEQARNEALDAARRCDLAFDYLLFCDADMELVVVRPGFRNELVEPAYWVKQRSATGGLEYDNLRLIRRDMEAHYRGVTHEYLDASGVSRQRFDGIWFLDHEAGANRANKFERDIALLSEALQCEPENDRYVFYLANSYFDLGNAAKALEVYQKRMTMGGWSEEVFYSSYRVGICHQQLQREADMIASLLLTFELYPHRAEPLHVLALHYQRQQRHRLAYQIAEMGARVPAPAGALFVEPEVYTWRLLDIMAVSLYYLDRRAEGLELNRRLLEMVPPSERARIRANIAFCAGQKQSVEAAVPPGAEPEQPSEPGVPAQADRTSLATPYTPQFFAGISEGSRRSALRVLPVLFELHKPVSVVDVGCGAGAWLNACRQLGIMDVVGIDGAYVDRNQLEIPSDRFLTADLATLTPQSLVSLGPLATRQFELALSLEVAEHLPPEAAHGFIDALCALAPVVLFSAALPHQGGTHHVHERFPSFWVPHFARHGFLAIDAVRKFIWDDENVEWWYRQNTLLFASLEAINDNPLLAAARAATRDAALDVIHPAHYQRIIDWAVQCSST